MDMYHKPTNHSIHCLTPNDRHDSNRNEVEALSHNTETNEKGKISEEKFVFLLFKFNSIDSPHREWFNFTKN